MATEEYLQIVKVISAAYDAFKKAEPNPVSIGLILRLGSYWIPGSYVTNGVSILNTRCSC